MAVDRITLSMLLDGQVVQNVFHMLNPDGATTLTLVADDIDSNWISQIQPFQHSGVHYYDIEVRQVSPAGLASFHKSIVKTGTATSEDQPDNPVVSRVLKFTTAVAGRHGRGRYYIPGVAFSGWIQGIVKPASITAGQTLVDALKARYVNAGHSSSLSLVVAPRSTPSDYILVNNIVQRTVLGYQRRRSIGVGI